MNKHIDLEKPFWIVSYNGIIHYGQLEEGQETNCSNEITVFATEKEWLEELQSKGVNKDLQNGA